MLAVSRCPPTCDAEHTLVFNRSNSRTRARVIAASCRVQKLKETETRSQTLLIIVAAHQWYQSTRVGPSNNVIRWSPDPPGEMDSAQCAHWLRRPWPLCKHSCPANNVQYNEYITGGKPKLTRVLLQFWVDISRAKVDIWPACICRPVQMTQFEFHHSIF